MPKVASQVTTVPLRTAFALAALLGALCSGARAVTLVPGVTVPLAGTSESVRPELGPPPVAERTTAFEIADPSTGRVRARGVVGAGIVPTPEAYRKTMLTFRVLDLQDVEGSGFRVEALTTPGHFNPYATGLPGLDADYRLDTPGDIGPAFAVQSGDFAPVTFSFAGGVGNGQTSHVVFLWVFDDLSAYGDFGACVTIGNPRGESFEVPFASYVAFVPEPAPRTALLLGLGLLGPVVARLRSGRSPPAP
jgi:hypothetical protein